MRQPEFTPFPPGTGTPSRAFAPANGSLIFETYEATATHGRGSLGVGFTLEAGVVAEVGPPGELVPAGATHPAAVSSTILVGGEPWDFPTVRQVIERLAPAPVRVRLDADLPFGCGFGMSGASALATAYAIGAHFKLPLNPRELALVAHEAEVDHSTGRGDVGGQFNGGFMVKSTVGAPLDVELLPIGESPVWCRLFGPISTSEVLRDTRTMDRVNTAGRAALQRLRAMPDLTLDSLLALSRQFAENSGLLTSPRVRQSIADALAAGGQASMVMLGEAVVSSVPIPGAHRYRVVKQPARLLPPG
jgi:pantoate kinase